MTQIATYSILVFSVLMLLGGIMGFAKAKSKPSLIAGVVSAVLLAVCFAVSLSNAKGAIIGAAAISALLAITFLMRLLKTKKVMPSGMLLALSLLELGLLVASLLAG